MKNSTTNSQIANSSTTKFASRLKFKFKAIVFVLASILFSFSGAFAQTPDVDVSIIDQWQSGSSDFNDNVIHTFIFTNTSTNTSDRFNISARSSHGWVVALFDSANYDLLAFDVNGNGTWDYVNPRFDSDLNGEPDTRMIGAGDQVSLNFAVYIPLGATVGDIDTIIASGFSMINRNIFDSEMAFTEVTSPMVLPVELISFTARLNGKGVNINWATATEINNDYFSVERSADGKNFEEILVVRGGGNKNSISAYTIEDKAPLNGVSYYRLKQTDYDGKSETFSAVFVNNNSSNEAAKTISIQQNAYPNPFDATVELGFNVETAGIVTATIMNLQGKILSSEVVNSSKGYNTFSYNGSNLPRGMYFISLEYNGNVITSKISKNTDL